MDLPFHRIHDITHSYGVLLLPVGWNRKLGVRWLMYSTDRGRFRRTTAFHNCTVSGVY